MNELWNLDPLSRMAALLIGMALIAMGRRLFWLFVAVSGFVVGWFFAVTYLLDFPLPPLAVAALVGLFGAVAALFAQKIAVVVAGVIMGALIGRWVLPFLPIAASSWEDIIVIAAALAGAIAARQVFEGALTVLTSAAGALLVVDAAGLAELPALFLFGALTAVGWLVQTRHGRRRRR